MSAQNELDAEPREETLMGCPPPPKVRDLTKCQWDSAAPRQPDVHEPV